MCGAEGYHMRRTALSVLVAIASFVVTAAVLIGGFQLVAGGSEPPKQGSTRRAAEAEQTSADATPAASAAAREPDPTDSTTGPFFGSTTGIGVGPGRVPAVDEPLPSEQPTEGLLSEDFRKLGLDDPTTEIDERLPSTCEVVSGTAAGPVVGPVLCLER